MSHLRLSIHRASFSVLLFMGAFLLPLIALAQVVVTPDATPPVLDITDPAKLIGIVLSAAVSKDWGVLICGAIVALMGLQKKFIPKESKVGVFMHSKLGGWLGNFVLSAAVTLLASQLGKIPLSLSSIMSAITTGLGAAGAYELWGDITKKDDREAAKAAGAAAAANPGPTLNG